MRSDNRRINRQPQWDVLRLPRPLVNEIKAWNDDNVRTIHSVNDGHELNELNELNDDNVGALHVYNLYEGPPPASIIFTSNDEISSPHISSHTSDGVMLHL